MASQLFDNVSVIYGDTESLELPFSNDSIDHEIEKATSEVNYLKYLRLIETKGKVNEFYEEEKEEKEIKDDEGYEYLHIWVEVKDYFVYNDEVLPKMFVDQKTGMKDWNFDLKCYIDIYNYHTYKDKLGNIYYVSQVSNKFSEKTNQTYAGYHQLKFVN